MAKINSENTCIEGEMDDYSEIQYNGDSGYPLTLFESPNFAKLFVCSKRDIGEHIPKIAYSKENQCIGPIFCNTCNDNCDDKIGINTQANGFIYALRIKCKHNNNGCKWVGFTFEYDNHLRNDCLIEYYNNKNNFNSINNVSLQFDQMMYVLKCIRYNNISNNIVSGSNNNINDINSIKHRSVKMFDSDILKSVKERYNLFNFISKTLGINNINIERIYSGKNNGFTSNIFHKYCDNIMNTITLIKNNYGTIFGGYASVSWTNKLGFKQDLTAFLFKINNDGNIDIFKQKGCNGNNAIYCNNNCLTTFGDGFDLFISNNCNNNYNNISKISKYITKNNKGIDLIGGPNYSDNNCYRFKVINIEVLKINLNY